MALVTPSRAPKAKTFSFRLLMGVIASSLVITAVYMTWVIRAVPKTVSNSKAGIFAELVDKLLLPYESGAGLQPAADYDAINLTIREKFQDSPWALRPSLTWQLESWADATLKNRPLLMVRFRDAEGRLLLLGIVPISKRNFPRTGGFSYRDAWFFTFGRDYTARDAVKMSSRQVPSQLVEVERLEKKGLNLVATNYGNDFYILMLSAVDSKQLGRDLFQMTSIYETAP